MARYGLITGERRLLASKQAGKTTIPAIVREVSNLQAMEMTIVENLQRADLNPMEQAHAFQRLGREFHMTQEQIAERTGKDRASVSNFLRLLKLPEPVQKHVEAGELSFGHARALLALDSAEAITSAAQKVLSLHLSVRATESFVQGLLNPEAKATKSKQPATVDPNVREAQNQLRHSLGLKVTIEDKAGKGRVIIEYSGIEDFDAILSGTGQIAGSQGPPGQRERFSGGTASKEEPSTMKATRFEYRFRFPIHVLIFLLGFIAPWLYWAQLTDALQLSDRTTWLMLAAVLARHGWLTFQAAAMVILSLALLFTGLGAWLRVWGAAYIGSSIVKSRTMHGESMLADGPYRRTRNPLYLGTLLHVIGISILMPPSGALVAVVLLWVFQIRLALAEEPFLEARFGQPYLKYRARVPRFLPTPAPQVPSAGATPRWVQAVLGELYFAGAFVTLAGFGWSFNAQPLRRGILISLGLGLIAQALLPRATPEPVQAVGTP